MEENLHHLGCIKLCTGKNYQPQLVIAGFLPSTVTPLLPSASPRAKHPQLGHRDGKCVVGRPSES